MGGLGALGICDRAAVYWKSKGHPDSGVRCAPDFLSLLFLPIVSLHRASSCSSMSDLLAIYLSSSIQLAIS